MRHSGTGAEPPQQDVGNAHPDLLCRPGIDDLRARRHGSGSVQAEPEHHGHLDRLVWSGLTGRAQGLTDPNEHAERRIIMEIRTAIGENADVRPVDEHDPVPRRLRQREPQVGITKRENALAGSRVRVIRFVERAGKQQKPLLEDRRDQGLAIAEVAVDGGGRVLGGLRDFP